MNNLNKDKATLEEKLANKMENSEPIDLTYDEWGIKRLNKTII